MDKDVTFAERTALLRQTASDLRRAAEVVLAEVERMEAAQERFAARKDGSWKRAKVYKTREEPERRRS